jgi:type IV pilus assembly protein PilX
MKPEPANFFSRSAPQRGASLIVVMMILIIVSLLGVGGAQIALMSERGARNDRDMQVAWQAAEAALRDAEFDMTTSGRQGTFDGITKTAFVQGCNTASVDGLYDFSMCPKPAWLTLNFDATAATVFGAKTGRTFASGNVGIQPAQPPLYMIELVTDPKEPSHFVYRVTAMGFGPRTDIQAVVQEIYRPRG